MSDLTESLKEAYDLLGKALETENYEEMLTQANRINEILKADDA